MMDLESIRATYGRYSRFYDVVFGSVMNHGRRLAVETAAQGHRPRILEVGVGTGISLGMYPRRCRVVGVDVSPQMLDIARRRTIAQDYDHVEALLEMDAESLSFPDASFDAAVAMYVVSVAPDPVRVVEEMRRVCVPGGTVLVLNHFVSRNPILRSVERSFRPWASKIGFRPDFEGEQLMGIEGLEVEEIRSTNPFGYWKLVCFRNRSATTTTA